MPLPPKRETARAPAPAMRMHYRLWPGCAEGRRAKLPVLDDPLAIADDRLGQVRRRHARTSIGSTTIIRDGPGRLSVNNEDHLHRSRR